MSKESKKPTHVDIPVHTGCLRLSRECASCGHIFAGNSDCVYLVGGYRSYPIHEDHDHFYIDKRRILMIEDADTPCGYCGICNFSDKETQ